MYQPGTVSTHLVSELGASVLEIARTQPLTLQDAMALLGTASESVNSEGSDIGTDLLLMEETINGLVAAGLLRRVE